MAKTIKFSVVVGVVAGYGHNNEVESDATEIVAKVWQKAAAEYFAATNIYVSGVVTPGKVVYHTDWGCPVGGEVVAVVSGSANPQFTEDLEAWKQAVIAVAKAVKTELKQSTISVEFQEVEDFVYLND